MTADKTTGDPDYQIFCGIWFSCIGKKRIEMIAKESICARQDCQWEELSLETLQTVTVTALNILMELIRWQQLLHKIWRQSAHSEELDFKFEGVMPSCNTKYSFYYSTYTWQSFGNESKTANSFLYRSCVKINYIKN